MMYPFWSRQCKWTCGVGIGSIGAGVRRRWEDLRNSRYRPLYPGIVFERTPRQETQPACRFQGTVEIRKSRDHVLKEHHTKAGIDQIKDALSQGHRLCIVDLVERLADQLDTRLADQPVDNVDEE